MATEQEQKIADLEAKIYQLTQLIETKFKKIDKDIADIGTGFEKYMLQEFEQQSYMSKLIWASYRVTHPHAIDTMIQAGKILGNTDHDDGCDPQP